MFDETDVPHAKGGATMSAAASLARRSRTYALSSGWASDSRCSSGSTRPVCHLPSRPIKRDPFNDMDVEACPTEVVGTLVRLTGECRRSTAA